MNEITWTNCAEKMPQNGEIIIQHMNDQPKLFDGSRFTEQFAKMFPQVMRYTRWTEYSLEKWEELNK